jgi:DNA-binding CsgD family transcriptional regulator/Mn-dependent DtxR family transcriptional regulator
MIVCAHRLSRYETPATSPWAAVGVSHFDETVYQAILDQPDAGVAAWARSLSISPSRIRRVCARLLDLGLLQIPDSEGGLRAVDPRIAVRALIRRRETESELLIATAQRMAAGYEAGQLRAEPSRLIEVVRGESASTARLAELYARAEHEVCCFDCPPYLAPRTPQFDLQADLLRRGVAYRTVYATAALEPEEDLANVRQMTELGEQARVLPALSLKLMLIDGKVAMLPLTSSDAAPGYSAVVVRHSAVTDALRALFELLWQQATPLGLPAPAVGGVPGKGERELVGLLAAGMKDEAVARHLGVSLRTLQRRVSDLQDRLGSGSRFQAGVQAARRGWV